MSEQSAEWELSSHAGPQTSPGFIFWHEFMQWQRGLNAQLKPFGLTQPQFAILAVCGWMTRDGRKTRQQDVVDFLKMDRMHVSQIAKRLEGDKLIERIASTDDQRAKYIRLTQLGLTRLAQALPIVEDYDHKFFAAIQRNKLPPDAAIVEIE